MANRPTNVTDTTNIVFLECVSTLELDTHFYSTICTALIVSYELSNKGNNYTQLKVRGNLKMYKN